VLSTDGILKRVKSKDLKVGNIVRIEGGDRVPADMVVLYSNGDQGTLFLKTDQLDGETDWKFRKSIKNIQSGIKTRRGR
jgi:phospholipid-translocating ATPase